MLPLIFSFSNNDFKRLSFSESLKPVTESNLCQMTNFLDQSNFKAFADAISNVVQIMTCVSDRVENIVGKGENPGYQHYLLFQQCFQKASLSGSLKKSGLCGKELKG